MSRRLLLQAAASTIATLSARAAASIVIGPAPGPADQIVSSAIARLPRAGGAVLTFLPGRYVFAAERGTALLFNSIEHLTLEGSGAELIFNGVTQPLHFQNCLGPTVRNLVIDWARPPFSQGVVTSLDPSRRVIGIQMAPEYLLGAGESVQALLELDARTGLMRPGAADIYGGLSIERAAPDGRLSISSQRPINLARGATVVLRHHLYGSNPLSFRGCRGGLTVSNVTVHAAPGMALYARNCRGDALVEGLTVRTRPGSGRLLSTNADGVHFDGCPGTVSIRRCAFASMGDDAVNVHSNYLRIAQIRGSSLLVERRAGPVGADDLPDPGAALELVSGHDLERLGEATLISAEAGRPATLHLAGSLPASLAVGDMVGDASARTLLSVTDCTFGGNRGRGVVGHADVTIERCLFEDQSRAAVFLAPDLYWMECCEVRHARVRDNRIVRACRSMPGDAAIEVTAITVPRAGTAPVNADVVIERNRIESSYEHAISVSRTQTVTVSDNTILSGKDAIVLDQVGKATVTGNRSSPRSVVRLLDTPRSAVRSIGNRDLPIA